LHLPSRRAFSRQFIADLAAVEQLFERYPNEIVAIIVEPVAGNMGVVSPVDGFLKGLREITAAHRRSTE